MGSPAMTTRELKEEDFKKIAEFVDRGIKIALGIHEQVKGIIIIIIIVII